MKIYKTAIAATLTLTSMAAHADYLGPLSGRSANPANNPALSVEGSFVTGSDYQNLSTRVNYNVNETITVYGDIGLSELGSPDGISFGGGVFYYLPVLEGYDSAIQASAHAASLDAGGFDTDLFSFGAAFLVSPQTPFLANGLNWYANAGLTLINFDVDVPFGAGSISVSDDSTEVQFGGGVYLPLGPGTVYGGADFLDVFTVGIGYRFGIQ